MFLTFKLGLLLGLSIIISIGSQNLFVIKQALKNENPYLCAFACFMCDFVMIIMGVVGVSALLLEFPALQKAMLLAGIIFLVLYGSKAIKRSFDREAIRANLELINSNGNNVSAIKLILLALSFSILNPQAILDCMIIIGGNANHYTDYAKYYFVLGTIAASLIWFFGLTVSTSLSARRLMSVKFWCVLELISGIMMIAFASSFVLKLA